MPKYYSTPKYVTIDLFGKINCGKTTIFELFAENRFLKDGGNLSYDFRTYYAKCWILKRRWGHTMVFLADPKLDMRWKDLNVKHMQKLFKPTNILVIVTDSTEEDVLAVKKAFDVWPRIKRKMIIFIVANMQDKKNRLSVEKIKSILQMNDVIGLTATDPGAKEKVKKFLENATIRYFIMLSKRGEVMQILDEDEVGFGKKRKIRKKSKKGKYSNRLKKMKKSLDQK